MHFWNEFDVGKCINVYNNLVWDHHEKGIFGIGIFGRFEFWSVYEFAPIYWGVVFWGKCFGENIFGCRHRTITITIRYNIRIILHSTFSCRRRRGKNETILRRIRNLLKWKCTTITIQDVGGKKSYDKLMFVKNSSDIKTIERCHRVAFKSFAFFLRYTKFHHSF